MSVCVHFRMYILFPKLQYILKGSYVCLKKQKKTKMGKKCFIFVFVLQLSLYIFTSFLKFLEVSPASRLAGDFLVSCQPAGRSLLPAG